MADDPVRTCVVRTCVGCGAKRAGREMLRVASQGGGVPAVDERFHAAGRGAYLCRNRRCAERAFARRALERTLKLHGPPPAAVRDEILRAIERMKES